MMNIVTGKRIFYIDVTLHSNADNSFVWCWDLFFIHSFMSFTFMHCSDIALNFIP